MVVYVEGPWGIHINGGRIGIVRKWMDVVLQALPLKTCSFGVVSLVFSDDR
jgi:hypothetical protein